MRHIEAPTMDMLYPALVDMVQDHGFWCNPRGKVCREVRPASFTLTDPMAALYTGPERKLSYRFFAAETLLYISGSMDKEEANFLCSTNRGMFPFLNQETGTFDGAYGPRMADGLQWCYGLLTNDIWTRQAVVSIWNNKEERGPVSKDVPCTLSLHFYATPIGDSETDIQLDMSATMRSNDLNWGTPYDVAAFAEIQCLMASCLGVKVGHYVHNIGSLHYYQDTPPKVEYNEVDNKGRSVQVYPDLPLIFEAPSKRPWSKVVQDARGLVQLARVGYYNAGRDFAELAEYKSGYNGESTNPWMERMAKLLAFSWSSFNSANKSIR